MTDILDPVDLAFDEIAAPPVPSTAGRPLPVLAALLASAGLIHGALAPSHVNEWAIEGASFAVAAWVQLGLAATLLRRPSTVALRATVVLNTVLVALWVDSRVWGFPVGPQAHLTERIFFVDGLCVAAEVLAVAGAVAVLTGARAHRVMPSLRTLAIGGVVIATTAALLSPSARNHAHAEAGITGDAHVHVNPKQDKGFSLLSNGHHAHAQPYALDPESQKALDAQLAITRRVAAAYPTVAAAEAAGYRRAGPYSPGLGAHYTKVSAAALNADGKMDEDKLLHPLSLQYDGTSPTSKIAGFMYYSISKVEPEGFVGRNDVWHSHTDICLRNGPDGTDAPFGADKQATAKQCAQVGGYLMKQTQWMVHVWSVPGYENSAGGVFGEENAKLTCSDGTYYVLPPDQWATHLRNICRSAR